MDYKGKFMRFVKSLYDEMVASGFSKKDFVECCEGYPTYDYIKNHVEYECYINTMTYENDIYLITDKIYVELEQMFENE